MSTTIDQPRKLPKPPDSPVEPLALENGARMTREEFHRLYEEAPESFRAELIGGVVFVSSPLRRLHGTHHVFLSGLLFQYEAGTPGVESGDNATLLLGADSEPQPDLYLRIRPDHVGQSRTTEDDYVEGAPELVIEIALSSRSLDLHGKRLDYASYGVKEYLVLIPSDGRMAWFDLPGDQALATPADGVIRSVIFPGLWLSVPAILQQDHRSAIAALQSGLSSTEHQAFVEQLAQRRAANQ